MTGKLEDTNAHDINSLIKYVMWSKDKIAGGVSQENAVKALARMIDYDVDLMKSISGKTDKEED
jgi:hypothetical protein